MGILSIVKPGVVWGSDVKKVYDYAKENNFALPAINTVGTNSINAALEAAKEADSPIIIQFSQGGGKFMGGNGIDSLESMIAGCIVGAHQVHILAEKYGVVVILHTDHANKKALPWIDGLIKANQDYFNINKRPLFSSHMLDLSVEPLKENISTCKQYFKKFNSIGLGLEIEVGITGGEEEGADTASDKSKMYTSPEELEYAYSELSEISENFTIAAMFGNVHGVYKPGNVELRPKILDDAQKYINSKVEDADLHLLQKPISFVFHGGSGSEPEKIREAISYGVVKMNVDTDTQWAFWEGAKIFIDKNVDYLQSQIGNPEGEDVPNKKYYDPRQLIGAGQESMKKRILLAFKELNALRKN